MVSKPREVPMPESQMRHSWLGMQEILAMSTSAGPRRGSRISKVSAGGEVSRNSKNLKSRPSFAASVQQMRFESEGNMGTAMAGAST
jgi:hypothetical protein